jgi:hypothetical protein
MGGQDLGEFRFPFFNFRSFFFGFCQQNEAFQSRLQALRPNAGWNGISNASQVLLALP